MIPTILFILTCTHATSSKVHHYMHEKMFSIISWSHAHLSPHHTCHLIKGPLNMHEKSLPLRYATYIQNIFWLHNNQIKYIIFIFIFSSYSIYSTMEASQNQITEIYCNQFPQQRVGYSPVNVKLKPLCQWNQTDPCLNYYKK